MPYILKCVVQWGALLCLFLMAVMPLKAQETYIEGPPSIPYTSKFYVMGKYWYLYSFIESQPVLYQSRNDGQDWKQLTLNKQQKPLSIDGFNETGDTLFIFAEGTVFFTTDHVKYQQYATYVSGSLFMLNNNAVVEHLPPGVQFNSPVAWNEAIGVMRYSENMGRNWFDISKGLSTKAFTTINPGTGTYVTHHTFLQPDNLLLTSSALLAIYYSEGLLRFRADKSIWEKVPGSNFSTLPTGLPSPAAPCPKLCYFQKKSATSFLFIPILSQLYSSTDDGVLWKPTGKGLPNDSVDFNIQMFERNDTLFAALILFGGLYGINTGPYRYARYGTDLARIYYSTDGGKNFNPMPKPGIPAGVTIHRAFVTDTDKRVIWHGANSFVTDAQGTSVIPRNFYARNEPAEGILKSEGQYLYYRSFSNYTETTMGLYQSADAGLTWKNLLQDIPNHGARSFSVKGDTIITAVPDIIYSTDAGKTWTKAKAPSNEKIEAIQMVWDRFMVITELNNYERKVYHSRDLENWTFAGSFTYRDFQTQPLKRIDILGRHVILSFPGSGSIISSDSLKTFTRSSSFNLSDCIGEAYPRPNGYLFRTYNKYRMLNADANFLYDTSIVSLNDSWMLYKGTDGWAYALFPGKVSRLDPISLQIKESIAAPYPLRKPGTMITQHQGKLFTSIDQYNGFYRFDTRWALSTSEQEAAGTCTPYPNPASEFTSLELPGFESSYIEVYNYLGQKIFSMEGKGTSTIPVKALPEGTYTLLVTTNKSTTHARLLVLHP